MKIKNKLTLIYTVITAVILGVLNFYIYFLSRSFIHNNFYSQLEDRANITATVFLEADEESSNVIKSFQKKYLQALPDEYIRVYDDSNKLYFSDTTETFNFDHSLINKIRERREYRIEENNRQTLGIYYEDNQGNFVIIASAIDEVGIKNLNQLQIVLLVGFFISIIVLFFAGRFFIKLMLKPVADIAEQANKISETNLHLRLNEGNKKDELAELSIIINRMLTRLEGAFDLQKSFVANASHELRTPLTSIIGNIEVTLTKARTVEEHKVVLASIMFEAEKLHKLTNGLLNLAQSNLDFTNLKKEEIRLDEILIELKDEIRVKRPDSKIELVFPDMPDNPSVFIIEGEKNLLENALLNLLDNACKFSDEKKVIVFLLLTTKYVTIKITDTGIGISQTELPHLIETFYRADNARVYSGSGIGLTLAEKIISMHGGKLFIASELNKGTEVTVSFPLY